MLYVWSLPWKCNEKRVRAFERKLMESKNHWAHVRSEPQLLTRPPRYQLNIVIEANVPNSTATSPDLRRELKQ